jgi:N-acetylneuraminate synthase/sialic acid synthase
MGRELTIRDRIITEADCFIIAEIGSNHGGDPDLCEKMIITAAKCGVDAVKLQKRDNDFMFTKGALARPYQNEYSYGKTYGEHRQRLDWFGEKEFRRFKATADKYGVIFFATPFEERSADFLHGIGVELWKIASCDVTNLPLVIKVARYEQPIIISTGGASWNDILTLTEEISGINDNFALLHCVSTYPNEDKDLNLKVVESFLQKYPENIIGFSSHHPGILPLMVARALGASIFEVHFTLNRGSRGTDHGFSMEPHGLETICQDLKRVSVMLGTGEKVVRDEEKSGFVSKMGKGIYLNRPMKAGEVIGSGDIVLKSPADILKPIETHKVVGHVLVNDLSTGIPVRKEMVE